MALANLTKNAKNAFAAFQDLYKLRERALKTRSLLAARRAKLEPKHPVFLNNYAYSIRKQEEEIWVDETLPESGAVSREDFLAYHRYVEDSERVSYLMWPFVFGGLGLAAVPYALASPRLLPSTFARTKEDVIARRHDIDMKALKFAACARAQFVWHLELARTKYVHSYTKANEQRFKELQSMDEHSLNIRLFDYWMGQITATVARLEFVPKELARQVNVVWGRPAYNLGHSRNTQHAVQNIFEWLWTDDCFIRHGGGSAALSDEQLFDACWARRLARAEELPHIKRASLTKRLDLWLELSTKRYTDVHGHAVRAPCLFFAVLSANVFCDPPYDAEFHKLDYARIASDKAAGEALESDLRTAYETHLFNKRGQLAESLRKSQEDESVREFNQNVRLHQAIADAAQSAANFGVREAVKQVEAKQKVAEHVAKKGEYDLSDTEKASLLKWLTEKDKEAQAVRANKLKVAAH